MRRDLTASLIAAVVLTLLFGVAYPLVATGVSQILFPNKADGSQVKVDGTTVGSRLIAQGFKTGKRPNPRYFQPRPSVTGYSGDVTFFNNLGPNSKELAQQFRTYMHRYLALEGPYMPGLTRADVPVDAVTNSASGVDPLISEANARIQANRIAKVRTIPFDRVLELIDENTDGRALGVLGEPGVNVLELNIALDKESRQ